jgi:hypothetical protein
LVILIRLTNGAGEAPVIPKSRTDRNDATRLSI